jgi:predicted DNA-binding protein
MPTRKKEILVSSLDATETFSHDSTDSSELITKPVKPSRPKRKPTQSKVAMKPEAIGKSAETSEDSATIETTEPKKTIKHTSELAKTELEAAPTKVEIEEPVRAARENKKQRKETHTKEKFYIRNDLLERLKALTKGKGKKSIKTTFINDALEKSLNELEITKK